MFLDVTNADCALHDAVAIPGALLRCDLEDVIPVSLQVSGATAPTPKASAPCSTLVMCPPFFRA